MNPIVDKCDLQSEAISIEVWPEEEAIESSAKMENMDMTYHNGISMIVPTFRRPAGLRRALESLQTQSYGQKQLEIIVSDNDPDGSAQAYVNEFAKTCEFPVKYIHAPKPGVANARNAALEAAEGRYLAFLDDDQFASPNWLSELMKIMEKHGAGLAFCPTFAESPVKIRFKAQCLDFFSRNYRVSEDGIIDKFFGCGNSLLDRDKCEFPNPPFSPDTNETGGEDDLLFALFKSQGVKNVWTRQTHAGELVADWRMTHDYIKVRSFAYGQGPSRICADPENFNLIGLIRWSLIGTVQFCLFSPLAFFMKLLGHSSYIKYMRKASEGAGKVLWYERFRPKIYGATALKAKLKRERKAKKKALRKASHSQSAT